MELFEKLHKELQKIKEQLNDLPSKEEFIQSYQAQKEALERKNPRNFMDECILHCLEQDLADKEKLDALYKAQQNQFKFELKYHTSLSVIRAVLYPTLAEYGGGATGPNGEMYNDMIGY